MSDGVKISIIIPIYNSEKYLEKCLHSIEQQTFKSYEIVLVNDGSTDNSGAIIEQFRKKEICPVQYLEKKNAGQAAARNDGLRMAKGEYIAFMDSDDYIKPDYLERLYQAAVRYNSEAVTCGYEMVDEAGKLIRRVQMTKKEVVPYGRAGMYVVWCRLYKRQFLIEHKFEFEEGGKIYEDVPFCLLAKFTSQNPVTIGYEGYYYVQRPGSTMSSAAAKSERFPDRKLEEAVKQALQACGQGQKKQLEFEVIHFFTGFFFRYCKKAAKSDLNTMIAYAEHMLHVYFPNYRKNPYAGLFRNKELPLLDRVAVDVFLWTERMNVLRPFTYLITRF